MFERLLSFEERVAIPKLAVCAKSIPEVDKKHYKPYLKPELRIPASSGPEQKRTIFFKLSLTDEFT
jgi:hypothetical protein